VRSYAEKQGLIMLFSERTAYERVAAEVMLMPDDLSCVQVCDRVEELVEVFGFKRRRGRCGMVDHEWFENNRGVILDPYRPGCFPQVLVLDGLIAGEYKRM
jgi:hypothetical protein